MSAMLGSRSPRRVPRYEDGYDAALGPRMNVFGATAVRVCAQIGNLVKTRIKKKRSGV